MQRLATVLEGENKGFNKRLQNDICAHWRFVDEEVSLKSSDRIYSMFCEYKRRKDFVGMDMARNFLVMDSPCQTVCQSLFGTEYAENGSVSPQRKTTSRMSKQKGKNLQKVRDVAYDPDINVCVKNGG